MNNIQPFILTTAKLTALTLAGYGIFQTKVLQQHILRPLIAITINVLFPCFFIYSFSLGWNSAIHANLNNHVPGWTWMLIFFSACCFMVALQMLYGSLIIKKCPYAKTNNPRELIALFAVHNAGFIPLPILKTIVPPDILVYMFFYVMAFNIIFWTVAVSFLDKSHANKNMIPRFNMPLAGILAGLIIAIMGWYQYIPHPIHICIKTASDISIYLILIILGGIIAGIPRKNMKYQPAFGCLILFKMILFPLLFLITLLYIPMSGLSKEMSAAIKLALVLEACVPPATNLILVSKSLGTSEQTAFIGNTIIFTYGAGIFTIPLFLLLSAYLFY